MPDKCNNCGACCYDVKGWDKIWKELDWLLPDGSCKFYDPWVKQCKIFERRPPFCREDCTYKEFGIRQGLTRDEWSDKVAVHCDDAHLAVFGSPREQDRPCDHMHLGILEIQIETTAACNARCHFCPYPTAVNDHRRGKVMDESLFHKIADEVATIPQIKQFVFNGLGEPLSDKRIYDFITYVRKAMPNMRTLLHTNGVYLTDPKRLHDAGLNALVVSLNAVNGRQHEQVMGLKGKFDKICSNIEEARKITGWTVTPRAVYSKDRFNDEDVRDFKLRWGKESLVAYETNWIGLNRTRNFYLDENEGCPRALSQIYVAYNGDLHMCCMDALGKIVFGNAKTQTIREVYNSPKYVEFRLAHAENRALDVPECKGCTRC